MVIGLTSAHVQVAQGFFGLGIWEILLIFILALIIFGPSKLPELARSLGEAITEFKRSTSGQPRAEVKEVETKKKGKTVRELAEELGIDTAGKTDEELAAEIAARIKGKKES